MKIDTLYDEQHLLSLLAQGNQEAFALIYEKYSRTLLAIAFKLTLDKGFSEEIVQEVFVNLWERRSKLQINSLGPYLGTAVKFSIFRVLQRERRRNELLNDHFSKNAVVLDEQYIQARFLQEYINGIVEELPPQCKLVFRYSREKHLTIPEISAELGIAEKTVQAHLSKALLRIRTRLRDSGVLLILGAEILGDIWP